MELKNHSDGVYATTAPNAVRWFQEHADLSQRLIRATGVAPNGAIIDVGGDASTLVDDLLADGFTAVTVLDQSAAAMNAARRRLGLRAPSVRWLQAGITMASLAPQAFDVWHHRAAFHFLTAAEDRATYVQSALRAVKPGGHVIVATFAEAGAT